jgi:hypothetical protein
MYIWTTTLVGIVAGVVNEYHTSSSYQLAEHTSVGALDCVAPMVVPATLEQEAESAANVRAIAPAQSSFAG